MAFAQALQKSASAYGPTSGSIFSQGSSGWQKPKENPFLKPNPFATTEKPDRLPSPQPSKPLINPFATNGIHSEPAPQPPAGSKLSTAGTVGDSRPNPFSTGPSSTSSPAQDWTQPNHGFVQPAWQASKDASGTKLLTSFKPTPNGTAVNGKALNGNRMNGDGHQENPMFQKNPQGPSSASKSAFSTTLEPQGGEKMSHQTPGSQKPRANRRGDVAKTIRDQLAKDGIKPPQWPSNPGSVSQRKAVEKFREAYSAYREKAMKSLIRAGLFDDPDTKRRLEDAINFKGICEDMCPDWDKVTRIVQHDVRKEEKEEINGELVASLPLMVTRYSRSSAGQDLPLPMDVRSPAALRRTLDYLITELIPSDDLLPVRHHFLWDRTRAIRREFTFQGSAMNREEKQDYLYCLETITRFHVTALHLLSQPDFAHESFSEQQEIEQLSKTLISLMEAYEDCAKEGIVCENQAEFRGYYIIFNAGDPSLMEKIQSWGPEFLQLEGIKTAICLVQSLQNTWTETGPLMPRAETEMALSMAAMFFSIVASPQISYTMACFAEVHFGSARHAILQTILNGYQRPKNGTKDITPTFLKERLHFDAEEEAIEFAELHQFKFRKGGANQQMMLLPTKSQRKTVPKPRVPHAYSYSIVEHKRGSRSLPDVIHHTVWDEGYTTATGEAQPISPHEDSLFVENTSNGDGVDEVESTVDTAVAPFQRPEEGKPTFLSSVSSPPTIFAPSSKQNGLSTAPPPNTQGVQSRDFAPQVNGSLGTSSPLFKKPMESVFNQGSVKKLEDSTASSATLGAIETDGKTAAQSSTASSSAPSVFSFLSDKSNAPTAPSTSSQSKLFQFPPISSTSSITPPASVLSNAASAPSTGPLFPPSSGIFGSTAKPTSTTKSPISLGDATLKPKESTPSTGGLSFPTSESIKCNYFGKICICTNPLYRPRFDNVINIYRAHTTYQ
ncbi:actin cytoskeleton and mitosis protein [Diatrype stigma]|uniref:Actin cytoskeleton and mitosis protein n=1 Tax=Diatrype stigma TaxID=117547 RepID=A0AAN9UM67_9PEZI